MKYLSLLPFLLAPNLAFAAGQKIQDNDSTSLVAVLNTVKNYLLAIVGALFLFFIVVGAIQFITSSGDPERAKKARRTLTYAIIGLVAVLLVQVIYGFLTGELMNIIFGGRTFNF